MNDAVPCPVTKCSAYVGSTAFRIAGALAMFQIPIAPIEMNQTAHTGPKNRPTTPVPCRWIANNAMRMPIAIGTT